MNEEQIKRVEDENWYERKKVDDKGNEVPLSGDA